MTLRHLFRLFVATGTICVAAIVVADENPGEKQTATDVKAERDRYEVPDADVGKLVEFLEALQSFRPATADEFSEYQKRGPDAMKQAAAKILEKEQDRKSEAARKAAELLLGFKVRELGRAGPLEQSEVYEQVKSYLESTDQLSRDELSLAFKTASTLEQTGNTSLAVEAYAGFGELFSRQTDELLSSYGKKMLGAARRADLLGNEMEITGTKIDGEAFDWSSYRGKVVLVDFWATWCGPCVAELPNVRKHFDQYHQQGFDVVGISLDTDRRRLEKFIEDRDLPWVTLYEDGAGWDHPMATYYGVMGIPTVILVDQDGRVVSLNARGPELGRQLAQLLGPAVE